MQLKSPHPSRARGRAARGVVLIEVLVALLIFLVGILGLVGLQAAMTKAQSQGKFRADAAFLAEELVGTLWGDKANVGNYTVTAGACDTTGNARCTDWVDRVTRQLPGGSAVVTVSSGDVTITITWTAPGEGTHRYQTFATIRAADA